MVLAATRPARCQRWNGIPQTEDFGDASNHAWGTVVGLGRYDPAQGRGINQVHGRDGGGKIASERTMSNASWHWPDLTSPLCAQELTEFAALRCMFLSIPLSRNDDPELH